MLRAALAAGSVPEHAVAEAHANLGTGLSVLGRRDEAMAAFRLALSGSPQTAMYRYNYGIVLAEMSRGEEAIVQYRIAARLNPTHESTHNK